MAIPLEDPAARAPVPGSAHGPEDDARHEGGALACGDCAHPLSPEDKFCSACGQPTRLHPPTLWEFVHEWLLHYVALEGKLWKSLWALMVRPGFLTQEYLAGRRQRYVQPLRLLLTLGVLFFLVLKLIVSLEAVTVDVRASASAPAAASSASAASGALVASADSSASAAPARPAAPAAAASEAAQAASPGVELPDAWMARLPAKVQSQLEASNARARADPQAEIRRVSKAVLGMAPYAVLLSLPLFAGLLKLLFRSMPFGAHFVFALHLHAAWYGCLLLIALVPWLWAAMMGWIWAHLYPVMALQRVHVIGWRHALGKSIVLGALHLMLILTGVVVLILLGVTLEP